MYNELFAPEEARPQLEQALDRAQGLQSQYWINHVCGALAETSLLLDDPAAAQTCLENALSPETAMDTMGKRYCWVRRAELALIQDNPALALQIADRLITSAPGMAAGGVVTFLWMLKGEALTALGQTDKADALLQAAIKNARAQNERFLLWRVRASLGRLYRATNRQMEAQKEFSAARKLIDELTATVLQGKLKDNFRKRAYDMLR